MVACSQHAVCRCHEYQRCGAALNDRPCEFVPLTIVEAAIDHQDYSASKPIIPVTLISMIDDRFRGAWYVDKPIDMDIAVCRADVIRIWDGVVTLLERLPDGSLKGAND